MMLVLVACGGGGAGSEASAGSIEVSQSDFGSDWPLTVDSGTLACGGAGEVTFTANGTTYAVNGLAKAATVFPDIDPIWAKGEGAPRKDIGPLIQRGLELCG